MVQVVVNPISTRQGTIQVQVNQREGTNPNRPQDGSVPLENGFVVEAPSVSAVRRQFGRGRLTVQEYRKRATSVREQYSGVQATAGTRVGGGFAPAFLRDDDDKITSREERAAGALRQSPDAFRNQPGIEASRRDIQRFNLENRQRELERLGREPSPPVESLGGQRFKVGFPGREVNIRARNPTEAVRIARRRESLRRRRGTNTFQGIPVSSREVQVTLTSDGQSITRTVSSKQASLLLASSRRSQRSFKSGLTGFQLGESTFYKKGSAGFNRLRAAQLSPELTSVALERQRVEREEARGKEISKLFGFTSSAKRFFTNTRISVGDVPGSDLSFEEYLRINKKLRSEERTIGVGGVTFLRSPSSVEDLQTVGVQNVGLNIALFSQPFSRLFGIRAAQRATSIRALEPGRFRSVTTNKGLTKTVAEFPKVVTESPGGDAIVRRVRVVQTFDELSGQGVQAVRIGERPIVRQNILRVASQQDKSFSRGVVELSGEGKSLDVIYSVLRRQGRVTEISVASESQTNIFRGKPIGRDVSRGLESRTPEIRVVEGESLTFRGLTRGDPGGQSNFFREGVLRKLGFERPRTLLQSKSGQLRPPRTVLRPPRTPTTGQRGGFPNVGVVKFGASQVLRSGGRLQGVPLVFTPRISSFGNVGFKGGELVQATPQALIQQANPRLDVRVKPGVVQELTPRQTTQPLNQLSGVSDLGGLGFFGRGAVSVPKTPKTPPPFLLPKLPKLTLPGGGQGVGVASGFGKRKEKTPDLLSIATLTLEGKSEGVFTGLEVRGVSKRQRKRLLEARKVFG